MELARTEDELLLNQVTGYFVAASLEGQRIYGFFDTQKSMKDFLKAMPLVKIIAIKRVTHTYTDGEGLNYAKATPA